MKLLYGLSLFLLVIFSYLFIDANFFYLKPIYTGVFIQNRELSAVLFFVFIVLLFFWYFYWLSQIKRDKLAKNQFFIIILLTIGVLVWAYPAVVSFDIFNYTTTSKILFSYHENPYIIMPIEFPNDAFLQYTRAANKVALYGPAWLLLTAVPYLANSIHFLAFLFSLKLMIALFYVGIGYVLWLLKKNLYTVGLFLLNPLIILETLVSGHNYVVMIFLALAAFYMFFKKKTVLGLLLFILSIFIKYSTFFLLPTIIYILWGIYTRKTINWDSVFLYSSILMMFIFFLSPIREEMYPWYWIWILPFSVLCENKYIKNLSILFSFSLLLRYLPALYTGSYFGYSPTEPRT